MSTLKATSFLLVISTATVMVTACGKSGSQTGGSPITTNNPTIEVNDKNTSTEVKAVTITSDNAQAVAGSALKQMLLSDMSANALDNAVNLTREQNSQIANLATGVVISMQPVYCLNNGTFTLQASLESTGENIQIDFADNLDMSFTANFNECDQGFASFNGVIGINLTAVINDLLDTNNVNLDTTISIDQLTIQQEGFNPFVINGELGYRVFSTNGETLITEVNGSDMYYAADNSYQVIEIDAEKRVHLPTGDYEYSIYGRYVDQMVEGSLIEYHTIEPLKGTGFTVPQSGSLLVMGDNDSMTINVLNSETVELLVDYDNDNSVDEIITATWQGLVLDSLAEY